MIVGPWAERAACRGQTSAMYPEPHDAEALEAALAHCRRCPVVEPCWEYALATREPWGVWGGMTARERRRARGRAPQRAA